MKEYMRTLQDQGDFRDIEVLLVLTYSSYETRAECRMLRMLGP